MQSCLNQLDLDVLEPVAAHDLPPNPRPASHTCSSDSGVQAPSLAPTTAPARAAKPPPALRKPGAARRSGTARIRANLCPQLQPAIRRDRLKRMWSRLLQEVGLLGLMQAADLSREVAMSGEVRVVRHDLRGDLPRLRDHVLVTQHRKQLETGAPAGL